MRRQRGFTLIELMITLAILGTLAVLAVSYNGTFFYKMRLNQLARSVYTAMSVARAEAVRQSRHSLVEFESTRVVAFIDSQTSGTQWKYDSGIDQTLYLFNFSDANIPTADLNMDTSQLTTGVSGTGSITPSIIFTSSGYSVKRSTSNTLETLAEVGVTLKHNKIPASGNVMRRVETTVAGAIRVLTH